MGEEREGRRVLFGIHKDDFSVICRGILYSTGELRLKWWKNERV
jgi:hypothetical protein